MMIRVAICAILLAVVACRSPLPITKDAPRLPEAPAGVLTDRSVAGEVPPRPAETPAGIVTEHAAAATAPPTPGLGRWQQLFERDDFDPVMIDGFLAEVRSNPGARRTILLETTLTWGCPCPTWVFPFHQDMTELRNVMVLPSPNLTLDPTDFATPGVSFRMSGGFKNTTLTGLGWVKQRGKTPPNFPREGATDPAVQEYWSEPGLVFIVERWCFDATAEEEDARWLLDHGASACGE